MKFFDEPQQPVNEDIVQLLSQRLYSLLKRENKLVRGTTLQSLKKVVRRLCTSIGVTEVSESIMWYLEHMDEEFVPQIYCASHLAMKFDKLVKAIDLTDTKVEEPIEESNQRVAEELIANYSFPVEILARMPLLVQRTKKNWDKFRASIYLGVKEATREQHFIDTLANREIPTFVGDWMICISQRLGRLQNYYGSVMKLAFTPSSEVFKKHFWQQWSLDWCNNPNQFDSLLAKLVEKK